MSTSRGWPLAIGIGSIAVVVVLITDRQPSWMDDERQMPRTSRVEQGALSASNPQWSPATDFPQAGRGPHSVGASSGSAARPDWTTTNALQRHLAPLQHDTEPGNAADEEIAEFVEAAQNAPDPDERAVALLGLRGAADRSVAEELLHSLGDPDPEVRSTALEQLALDRIQWSDEDDDDELFSALSSSVQDPSPIVRITALRLASQSDTDRALGLVRQAEQDSEPEVRDWAAMLLASADEAGDAAKKQ